MKPLAVCLVLGAVVSVAAAEVKPVIEIEEDVYTFADANNGAGPMWCSGSTCLVRAGSEVFVSGLKVIPGAEPLNNCRWFLLRRGERGWERVWQDAERTREPSPLALLGDGRVVVSTNPTMGASAPGKGGPARPEVVQFAAGDPRAKPVVLVPEWDGAPKFTEHSYRSFAADGAAGECVLFQNIGYTHAEWAFRDREGKWSAHGQLKWPWGADYDKPQPVRVCYPAVALWGRAVHFFGVSDIVEPYNAWRAYKRELTGREWDYDFRRLFYTWTRDIARAPFAEWIEIASRDQTCGWLSACDLWLAPNGDVHLLWAEKAIDERLRAKFFPEAKQSHTLNHAIVREGRVVHRRTLTESTEERSGLIGAAGRFHAMPDGRLFAVYHAAGVDTDGRRVAENRIEELRADGAPGAVVRLPFAKPFRSYFTATERAGCAPSATLELLGLRVGTSNTISYARVQLDD
ncbi:MAG: hypothetical protein HZA93_15505 [Verrucomicrobia bacterium]|nr:hypothetical protein [Verrucomicrobiota bacterium]